MIFSERNEINSLLFFFHSFKPFEALLNNLIFDFKSWFQVSIVLLVHREKYYYITLLCSTNRYQFLRKYSVVLEIGPHCPKAIEGHTTQNITWCFLQSFYWKLNIIELLQTFTTKCDGSNLLADGWIAIRFTFSATRPYNSFQYTASKHTSLNIWNVFSSHRTSNNLTEKRILLA